MPSMDISKKDLQKSHLPQKKITDIEMCCSLDADFHDLHIICAPHCFFGGVFDLNFSST